MRLGQENHAIFGFDSWRIFHSGPRNHNRHGGAEGGIPVGDMKRFAVHFFETCFRVREANLLFRDTPSEARSAVTHLELEHLAYNAGPDQDPAPDLDIPKPRG